MHTTSDLLRRTCNLGQILQNGLELLAAGPALDGLSEALELM
eukprot:CAMPEP_0181168470 /NCGR_PEP_ID=MMETSP1096-20121128/290_1 /TAXON_ID=156174 ORGANISM="Chrysochromulina ericina, Strain CCMP281" /NCGR_SAMPLE_ID=MMETSP1096 /ASSEMBLY_ACC=CAM_ASM_000453 /LENGTH=41 /DNA_ID= /DNA_START= /DNA_END= /DNA_ORIENTATION=